MTVHIIGLGATAQDFKPVEKSGYKKDNFIIGVNDATCEAVIDARVCVDKVARFTHERFRKIVSPVPWQGFFTQIDEWECTLPIRKINLKAVHAHNNRWNEFIPSSNNSPFVACGVAYKYFGATEIRLWGVDFNDHPNISGAMREQSVKDFQLLQKILNEKGCRIIPHEKSYLFGKI